VVPEKDLITEAKALAGQLAAGPTKAFGATKRLLQIGLTESFEAQMKNESRSIAEMARTGDSREGIRAFLEKRSPDFKGQ
jgi:2-(1,2-epoxy-1,2-dihydrophenyl)acetyl-CoA isomerase